MGLVSTMDQIGLYPPQTAAALIATQTQVLGTPNQSWQKAAADASAATATAETPVGRVGAAVTLGTIYYVPLAALTADNSNYATITVSKRTGAGGAVTVASVTTQITGSGNWTAFVPVAIPISAGSLAAGDVLTVAITKTGSGVVVPAGVLEIYQS